MKTMILATAAVLGLGVGAAFADSEEARSRSRFAGLPGVVAQSPVQNAPRSRWRRTGRRCIHVTQSNHGTWLFAPYQGNG